MNEVVKAKKGEITHKRLILLDAHAILHRAYHALPDFSTSRGEPTGALYGISTMLIKIIEDLKPDYVVAAYDLAGPTYRHEAYKEYKAGRKKADDALVAQMKSSRRIFEAFDIPIYDKAGFEADDMLGTIVAQIKNKEAKSKEGNIDIIIASGDMDTLQLVDDKKVQVYTLKKGIKDTIMYDEDAVMARFGFGPKLIPDYKGLRGDPSDNIIGVKGIGDKTATILITTFGTIEDMYKELEKGAAGEKKFIAAGITPRIIQLLKDNKEEAEFSKMLATIRPDAPIDFKLPEKSFMHALDIKKINALWNELEFRTLGQRLEAMMGGLFFGMNSSMPAPAPKKELPNIPKDEVEKVGVALWLIRSDMTNPTLEDVFSFAKTENFDEARTIIFDEMKKRGLDTVYNTIEAPLLPIVGRMEKRGVLIDRKLLKDLAKTYHKEADRLQKKIWEYAGVEFNVSSPKQLGEILFDKLELTAKNMKKTSGGARSTRESELEKLKDLHPIVPLIFEYRELTKLLGTYIDTIPDMLDENDRLHSDFIPAGTTTGRMASLDPNLQNIPVKTELGRAIRGAFIASPGFSLAAFDYSQVELRIAAFLSNDEKLIEIFKSGQDVHTSVASFVFKVPQTEVTADMRRQAKVINFGIIYGMGVTALKQNLGKETTRADAQKFYDEYFATFSSLAAYLDAVKAETARRGYTETFYGRRRYFEGINSKLPFIKAAAERMAINAPIQGTEADVVKLALIKIDEFIQKEGLANDVFPLLQVHDELVYEIREEKVREIAPKIEKIMESVMDPKDTKGVVLVAKSHIGKNWGELK
ncbi:MAG: DNA polymerase [Patescibacteria group bacterium]